MTVAWSGLGPHRMFFLDPLSWSWYVDAYRVLSPAFQGCSRRGFKLVSAHHECGSSLDCMRRVTRDDLWGEAGSGNQAAPPFESHKQMQRFQSIGKPQKRHQKTSKIAKKKNSKFSKPHSTLVFLNGQGLVILSPGR